jgi:NDP-sugar pyrophosphorylase family protein
MDFMLSHPVDILDNLNEYLSTFKGEKKSFKHSVPVTRLSKLVCLGKINVQPFLTYEGIIVIEEGVTIGPYCFLRGPIYIGKNVTIGPYTEIKRSIILENSMVTHRNIIPDSVIKKNVWLAGGVTITNLRIDKKPLDIKWNNEKKKTNKFGLHIENNSTLGVGVTVMPGTHVRPNKCVFGPTAITGVI